MNNDIFLTNNLTNKKEKFVSIKEKMPLIERLKIKFILHYLMMAFKTVLLTITLNLFVLIAPEALVTDS